MARLNANLSRIPPHAFSRMVEIDPAKVAAIQAHLAFGGTVPPVVAVKYDSGYMPIDGHHRLMAAQNLNMTLDAWIVPGPAFERLDCKLRDACSDKRAEDCVFCDGVPALQVANGG
jgi:hypothetical protein